MNAVSQPPRGIRNNNPGNLRRGTDKWQGLAPDEDQTDSSFWRFVKPEYGLRAIAITLRTYLTRYGLKTTRQIINRWAPESENDTDAYVNAVAKLIGEGPDDPINILQRGIMRGVVLAIVRHENGEQPYPPDLVDRALTMAGLAP